MEVNQKYTAALFPLGIESYSSTLGVGVPTLQLIADGLMQPTDYDLRASTLGLTLIVCPETFH